MHFEDVDYRRKKKHSCLFKNIFCESCFEGEFLNNYFRFLSILHEVQYVLGKNCPE